MIYLFAQILIVAISSWLLTKKYFNLTLFTDSILVSFLLFFAQIVLVETLLGAIGQLYFFNVFMAHSLILLIVLFASAKVKIPVFIKPNIDFFIKSNLIILAFSIFFSFFVIKAFNNLISPTLDADSLLYHLAFPAAWIKSGSLNTPFFIFGSGPIVIPGSLELSPPSYYPINGELFFTWFMLPLKNAFLADLGEVPFYIIGILAVYSILRKYDLNQKTAILAGFLLVLIPNIFKQIKTAAQIDVICAVLLLLVFFTLLLLNSNFNFKNAALFGISAGLFIGTKFNNVIWLMALLPLISYILYKGIKLKKFRVIKIVIFLGVIGLMVIIFGGYMYIKNYFFTGNPIFPVDLKIAGKIIFKGLVDSAAYRKEVFVGDITNLTKLFREGLGVQFFALILPCTFLPLFFYRYLRPKVTPFVGYMLIFSTPLFGFILFKIFIGAYVARYFFPYLAIGLISAVIFITKLPRYEKYFMVVSFVSFFAAAFELAHRYELVLSLLLSVVLFVVLALFKNKLIILYKSKIFSKVMLVLVLFGLLAMCYFNKKYNLEEFERYPLSFSKKEAWQIDIARGWKALNELTGYGSRVAYTGRQECYPLFGTGLKNEVKYVSVNQKEITPYNKPDGLYRKIKDFSAWRENLKKYKAEYLFIALPSLFNRESDDPKRFSIEDDWASAHPEDFQLLFSNSLSKIYKVLIK